MAPPPCLPLATLTLSALFFGAAAHNITNILSTRPRYARFNTFLSDTKVADDINRHQTITVLALANPAASSLADRSPSDLKAAVALLVLLDYFDPAKLRHLPDGPVTSTTLYQTTGLAHGFEGFVNVSVRRGGDACFTSAAAVSAAPPEATLVRAVELVPYNISVLEVSAPIFPPGFSAVKQEVNLTAALEKGGCGNFAALLGKTGVLRSYEAAMAKGVTVFAPADAAFKAAGALDVGRLSSDDTVALLLYHALPEYASAATLKSSDGRPFSTLASNGATRFEVSDTVSGNQMTIHADTTTAKVAATLVDSPPVAVFVIDALLLPGELFGKAPTVQPAPAPGPISPAESESSPAPSPDGDEPLSDSDEPSLAATSLEALEAIAVILGLWGMAILSHLLI